MIQFCNDKLLIFNLLLLMSVLACETKEILTLTAHERGKVEIRCAYESGYEEQKKYLCRGECPRVIKDKVVESGSAAKDKRFSLTDNKTALIFTVSITDLRAEDQGQYWCGINTGLGQLDDFTEIHLEIKHVSPVFGVTGEHLNISCHYESELKNNDKFICKGSDPSLCEKSAIKVSSEIKSNGRFSLSDNESAGVFTVTITDLTEEDSGIYWCGALQRGQEYKNKWISVTDLNISAERMSPKPTTTASFHTSKPATADTASDRPVITSSSSSSSSSSPPLSLFPFSPSKLESGFTPIIILSVMGILMVSGFLLLIFLRCRQKKEAFEHLVSLRGIVHVLAENLSTKQATQTVCQYEQITDNHSGYSLGLPVFDEHDASDTLIYSTVILQSTNHSDRTSEGQETNECATLRP